MVEAGRRRRAEDPSRAGDRTPLRNGPV